MSVKGWIWRPTVTNSEPLQAGSVRGHVQVIRELLALGADSTSYLRLTVQYRTLHFQHNTRFPPCKFPRCSQCLIGLPKAIFLRTIQQPSDQEEEVLLAVLADTKTDSLRPGYPARESQCRRRSAAWPKAHSNWSYLGDQAITMYPGVMERKRG
ncbi:hypothetical protein BDW66DRAFT_66338 [Aspergillus desertorum]